MTKNISFFSRQNAGLTIAASLFFIFGILVFCIAISEIQRSLFAGNWHKTQGKILKSEVVAGTGGGGGTRGRSKPVGRYKIIVEYSYVVSGHEYIGNRRTFSDSTLINNIDDANMIAESFPVDSNVDVYFSPTNPDQAVLDASLQKGSTGICVFGLILVLVSIAIFIPARKQNKTSENSVSADNAIKDS